MLSPSPLIAIYSSVAPFVASVAFFVLFVRVVVLVRRSVENAWRPIKDAHTGHINSNVVHVTITEVGPEGVKITIGQPDLPTETEESGFIS
jgi:hypothetical protein